MDGKFVRGTFEAALGVAATAVILVGGTLWTGRRASGDTGRAVRSVSHLFMDELASRREQVVATALSDCISDMDVALGLMEADDTRDEQSLRAYQARMKQLYGLEKFAFVDEDGLIYTSRGTRRDIALYKFDPASLAFPEISVKNLDGGRKKVIVAVPVDRIPFLGKTLVACFMEMDMGRLLDSVSLKSADNGTTFCNLYTNDGTSLTDSVLGGLASESNLLSALENAEFEDGGSTEAMRGDFASRREGVVSFTYNGIRETMYYVPVHGTDWVLTYLIRESVISNQIGSISDGIIRRNLALSVVSALVLVAVFSFVFVQARRNSRLTLEREVADAENRVKQEELEEQLALQQQITRQERKRNEQDRMITALASDYRSVFYVDLDADDGVCYRKGGDVESPFGEGDHFRFSSAFADYAEKYVAEAHRARFREFVDPASVRMALSGGRLVSLRYLAVHGGKESYEMLRMAGVGGVDGRVNVVGVGFSDIDEEMRDSLAKSRALSDALKAADEANRAKTVFLSNMSHEIRTPMNAIIGLDSLALHEPDLPERTRDYLEKIGSSAEHLLGLINDILDMSRIESGRMVMRHEEFSFQKLLGQVNTLFSSQCAEKRLSYNCRVAGRLDDFYVGDDVKLRQVLVNILGNAVKFTPEGGSVSLSVEKTAAFDGKSTLRFVIADTGIGMGKEFLPRIFESFSQEDSGAANKYGSSGLGMAITKSIVEMMNGEISVESEKGRGTTFSVTVTLQDCAHRGGDVEVSPGDMCVLVVDDDKVAADHARLVLESAGITVETALSGAEAVEMARLRHARREPYNLIVVDWKMPGMDGVETTRRLRAETGDESAIIILTAYNWDDILDEALAAGVDSFVAKPIFTGSLLEEFGKALRRKSAASAGARRADLEGRRVLLAEDMDVNAEIMTEVLSMRGMAAERAENGRVAVEMFGRSGRGYYDAILMDMRMPEMDGLEATAKIRAMDRPDAKTIPIIALTANAFDEDVQRSLQAGLNAHLSKPVQPDVLFETLEGML